MEPGVYVTIGIFMLVQTLAGVWWASRITAKVEFMAQTLATAISDIRGLAQERYTPRDAEKCQLAMNKRLEEHEARIRALEQTT